MVNFIDLLLITWFIPVPCLCSIEVEAHGCAGRIGQLYDIRKSQVGEFMFIHDIPLNAIASDFSSFVKTDIKEITKLQDKRDIIDLEASLSVSVLCGLISASGAAQYINSKSDFLEEYEVTYSTTTKTRREDLNFRYESLKSIFSSAALQQPEYTHVITGMYN